MGRHGSREEIPDTLCGKIWIGKERNSPQICADFITLINADRRKNKFRRISGDQRYVVSVNQRTILLILKEH